VRISWGSGVLQEQLNPKYRARRHGQIWFIFTQSTGFFYYSPKLLVYVNETMEVK